ncbi:PTS sugar transporter subunit IIB, partial [Salmonella enterica subsp. enterica serovar Dublin]|nr:PTS sugar transporter subunit IIB [Salmonella enterica]EDL7960228.1 PTS sugar transporter subunit IIB [Salmonella enterica subsp. enterica serovar Dublin]EBJ5994537.1 PTS sugar transporter subunit IIB [Salmonella enterica]EBQ2050449.1 PTS sugar transporter subunit IIB [Salmonella enterica]ECW8723475.1 PTS sugar transporter subunit IIB [Salmonella enterica]
INYFLIFPVKELFHTLTAIFYCGI